jgi:glycosyltransferase involved in cell wall biosynthesis
VSELVSVIIPAFNAEKTIARAVDSVLAQTYSPVEVIVVDDGSTDGTRGICESYGDKITYIHQANKGVSAARNKGIQTASGEYIGFLDADDRYLPEKLEHQLPLFSKYPESGIVSCAHLSLFEGRKIRHPRVKVKGIDRECDGLASFFAEGARGNDIINTNTVVIKKSLLEQHGGFCEEWRYGEDLELWARLAGKHKCAFIDKVLCVYDRTSESSVCSALTSDQHGMDFLYSDEEMFRFIDSSVQQEFKSWRENQLLHRLYAGYLNKNQTFVYDCRRRLGKPSTLADKLALCIRYLPVAMWPLACRVFIRAKRLVNSYSLRTE